MPVGQGDAIRELIGRSLRTQWRVNGRVIGVSVVVNNGKWGVDGEGSTNNLRGGSIAIGGGYTGSVGNWSRHLEIQWES